MGTILFIISVILSVVLYPLGFIYTSIKLAIGVKFKTWFKRIDRIFKSTATAVDQVGNVFMQEIFNDILIKKNGHKFGDDNETLSSVLGKNKQKCTLNFLGKMVAWILNKIDPNHVEKAITNSTNTYLANKIAGKDVEQIVTEPQTQETPNSYLANKISGKTE